MKFDIFMKVTLMLIALFLGIIALRPTFTGKFDNLRIWAPPAGILNEQNDFMIFDATNGDIWSYNPHYGRIEYVGRLTELGKPLRAK